MEINTNINYVNRIQHIIRKFFKDKVIGDGNNYL